MATTSTSAVPRALAALPMRTLRPRDAQGVYAQPRGEVRRLEHRGALHKLAHGYYVVVPQEQTGTGWMPNARGGRRGHRNGGLRACEHRIDGPVRGSPPRRHPSRTRRGGGRCAGPTKHDHPGGSRCRCPIRQTGHVAPRCGTYEHRTRCDPGHDAGADRSRPGTSPQPWRSARRSTRGSSHLDRSRRHEAARGTRSLAARMDIAAPRLGLGRPNMSRRTPRAVAGFR